MKFFNSQNFSGVTKGPVILNFFRPTDQAYVDGQFYKQVGSTWRSFPFNKGKVLEKATSLKINHAYAGYLNECNYTMTKETITRMPPHIYKYTFTLNKVSVHGYSVWDYARAVFTQSRNLQSGITPVYRITFEYDESTGRISALTIFTFEDLRYQNNQEYGGMLELGYDADSGATGTIYMNKYSGKSKTGASSASPTTLRDDMASLVPQYTSFFGRYKYEGNITDYNVGSCIRLSYTPEHTGQQVHTDESWNAWFYLSLGSGAWDPNADPDGGSGMMEGGMLGTNGVAGWGSRSLEFGRDNYPRQTDV